MEPGAPLPLLLSPVGFRKTSGRIAGENAAPAARILRGSQPTAGYMFGQKKQLC